MLGFAAVGCASSAEKITLLLQGYEALAGKVVQYVTHTVEELTMVAPRTVARTELLDAASV